MMLEISCPACKAGYVLDEQAVGAEFVCPSCTASFAVPALAATGAVGQESRGSALRRPARSSASPPSRPEPAVTRRPQGPPQAAAPAVPIEEIVCPRCNLHFSPKTRPAATPAAVRPTVLVVEEPGFFLKIAQDSLSTAYEVLTTSSVEQAQTLLAGDDVDLVVLNLGVEGPDSGRALLPGPFAKRCPILIYSADDESETFGARWEELQGLGADDIVIKGMSVAESLSRKVGALLGRPVDDAEDDPA